jgi:hypothetical protein
MESDICAKHRVVPRWIILIPAFIPLLFVSVAASLDFSAIKSTTTRGIISEYLYQLYIDDDYVVVGSLTDGFSYISTGHVNNPRAKVHNYRGRSGGSGIDRFGCSGFTKRASDNKIYAWYGTDIVEVLTKTVVYSSAPDYTHGTFSTTPKDRFTTDGSGNFWIGTSNLNADGSLYSSENGLYRIAANFSGKTRVLTDPVWNVFKDSGGTIWISTDKGIYRMPSGEAPTLVYNSQTASPNRWAEMLVEHNGQIYALMKNFFHNPNPIDPRIFELYRWDGGNFTKVCDILSDSFRFSAHAFVYQNALYIKVVGTGLYQYDDVQQTFTSVAEFGGSMGQYRVVARNNIIASVGNVTGVLLYNFNGDNQIVRLNSVNTSQGLLSDTIKTIYASPTTNRVYIGSAVNGFNEFINNSYEIYELPGEVASVGFFEHDGKLYVQGATNLYYLEDGQLTSVVNFYTNSEKIYYDSGRVWTFPNWGAGYGGIAVLNLSDLTIKGTKGYQGNDCWNTSETWTLDQGYHFYDVVSVPGEDAVFIAVGDSEIASPYTNMPFVLKYSYTTNTFTKVYLPDMNSEGIRSFVRDGTKVYGVARQKLYVFTQGGSWESFCNISMQYDFRGMRIADSYLFIVSGWNSAGGMEVVDLLNKTTRLYTSADIYIPSNYIFAIEIEQRSQNNYRLWLGTMNGVANCQLTKLRN